tara:strand:- start:20 stop:484 length:465 start_codon:yes stop_codon:yes gene_type:complete
MTTLHALNSKEIKKIHKVLEEQFGYTKKISLAFYRNNQGKIFLMTKDIGQLPLEEYRIDCLGFYLGTETPDGIRLTIEGCQLLGKDATKNVLDITEKDMHSFWLKGEDLEVETELHGFVIVRCGKDFLGSGKVLKDGRVINYVPKSRRLHVVNA